YNRKDEKGKQLFYVGGVQVCQNFYLRSRGINRSTYYRWVEDLNSQGITALLNETATQLKVRRSLKKQLFEAWVQRYAETFGDKMPDTVHGRQAKACQHDAVNIVLPYRDFKSVYEEYYQDFEVNGEANNRCTYGYAIEIFNSSSLQHIRLARDKGNFSTCKTCESLRRQILAAKSPLYRDQLKAIRVEHVGLQQCERKKYYKHRGKAIDMPDTYLSIIMDGMDQAKTAIPKASRNITLSSNLTQRIMGVKVHGRRTYTFLSDDSVKGGENFVCSCLYYVLKDLETRNELPSTNPTLYIQFDNCSENKNKTVFAFLSHLVQLGLFRKVKSGFLMVGHTHEDLDAYFSYISKHLSKASTVCPDQPSLHAALKASFSEPKDRPEVINIEQHQVYDFTAIHESCIDPEIAHHSRPHQFRFKKDQATGDVVTNYKMWSHCKIWLPH
ncbi:unnamed protein product, partial [Heterosigma akashiwo]